MIRAMLSLPVTAAIASGLTTASVTAQSPALGRLADGSWFRFPQTRWSFSNVRPCDAESRLTLLRRTLRTAWVRIAGYEEWTIGADGLIAESKGHFDEAEYQRQLKSGAPPAR